MRAQLSGRLCTHRCAALLFCAGAAGDQGLDCSRFKFRDKQENADAVRRKQRLGDWDLGSGWFTSTPAVARNSPFGEKRTQFTGFSWPSVGAGD